MMAIWESSIQHECTSVHPSTVDNMRNNIALHKGIALLIFQYVWVFYVFLLLVLTADRAALGGDEKKATLNFLFCSPSALDSELRIEGQKQRHPSGGISATTEMVLGMEGVELGADGKVVSYANFLYPTNALVGHKSDGISAVSICRATTSRTVGGSRYKPSAAKTIPSTADLGNEVGELAEYNPNLLDDPQWPCGKHKRVLIFASYMTTVIEYVKPSDLKKDMNETFKEKFPHIKLTLSKIRSLKREMRTLSMECNLEPITVSMAYVYFEKLVLQGKLNKQNRKLCAGACVLLAAKISSDLRKHEVKHLIDPQIVYLKDHQPNDCVNLEGDMIPNLNCTGTGRDLIGFEFTVLVALELALYLPDNQVLPHFRRLSQQS
ncbi:hypothetical protein Chor_004213 [Crotalus horridus]